MKTVNIHEAKTHLSKLVDQVAQGEPFIIAKAGKPMAKVIALDSPVGEKKRRIGCMAGQIKVPKDFDQMGSVEIERLFGKDQ